VNNSNQIQQITPASWLRFIAGVALLVAVAFHISMLERWGNSEFAIATQFAACAIVAMIACFVTQKFLSWPVAMLATATLACITSAFFAPPKFHPGLFVLDGAIVGIAVFIVLGRFEWREDPKSQIPDHEEV